jgi:hypothetical protein
MVNCMLLYPGARTRRISKYGFKTASSKDNFHQPCPHMQQILYIPKFLKESKYPSNKIIITLGLG